MSAFVLDASVAVAAMHSREPHHASSRALVDRVLSGVDSIVVPAVFVTEVVASFARRGNHPPATIWAYVDALVASSTVVTLGPKGARRAARLAMATRLRAADAVYVEAALREGVPLVTLDGEMHARASGHCHVVAP